MTRHERTRGSHVAAWVLGLVVFSLVSSVSLADDINRIVLRVNEEILTLHEYEARKASEISTLLSSQRLDATTRQERLEQVGQLVVQNIFSEMLLLSFANQQSIRVTDAEIEESVQAMVERQGIENESQLRQALISSGMTMEQLRDNARRELIWQRVVGREVQPKVKIDEEELRAYYRNNKELFRTPEQRWLKEVIILESSGLEDAELQRIAGEVHAALVAGGDPEDVVAPLKENGVTTGLIDLDWLRKDELEDSLAAAAWSLQPGEFSEPVAARGGYHIVHVADLKEATVKPLKEVQDLIARREYGTRFNRELRQFLNTLEENAYIQENLPEEAIGYRALAPQYEQEDELELFRAPILQEEEAAPENTETAG
ncbi:MAG: peptidylprolyl isomerase [Acidobacteriota bacterium]